MKRYGLVQGPALHLRSRPPTLPQCSISTSDWLQGASCTCLQLSPVEHASEPHSTSTVTTRTHKKNHEIGTLHVMHRRQSTKIQSAHQNGARTLKACELVVLSKAGHLALGVLMSVLGGPEHALPEEFLMRDIHLQLVEWTPGSEPGTVRTQSIAPCQIQGCPAGGPQRRRPSRTPTVPWLCYRQGKSPGSTAGAHHCRAQPQRAAGKTVRVDASHQAGGFWP